MWFLMDDVFIANDNFKNVEERGLLDFNIHAVFSPARDHSESIAFAVQIEQRLCGALDERGRFFTVVPLS